MGRRQPEVPYCGFFDLVGIKDLARHDTRAYYETLKSFQNTIWDKSIRLKPEKGEGIWFFSDCMFFQCANLKNIVDFIREVRKDCFTGGYYFKGSIMPGTITPVRAFQNPMMDQSAKAQKLRKKVLWGFYFGESAVDLFSGHEKLKGIGITVLGESGAKHKPRREPDHQEILASGFVPNAGHSLISDYYDIKYSDSEIRSIDLDVLLKRFLKAKATSKKLGRYYLTILMTWIRSIDIDDIDQQHVNTSNLLSLILGSEYESLFGDVAGYEFILLTLLGKVYEVEFPDTHLKQMVREAFHKRKKLHNLVEKTPGIIMKRNVKSRILDDLGREAITAVSIRSEIRIKISSHANKGLTKIEILEALRKDRTPSPDGKRWTKAKLERYCRKNHISLDD